LTAKDKTLSLKSVVGAQVVETPISDDVSVQQAGTTTLDLAALASALKVSGDVFKAVLDGQYVNFACGRTKGRGEVKSAPDTTVSLPAFNLSVPSLRHLLRSAMLRDEGGKVMDRILHFDGKAGTVRAESTDRFYAVTSMASSTTTAGKPLSASLVLPAKALDAVAVLLEDAAVVGFDERVLAIKSPHLTVSIPLLSSAPVRLYEDMAPILEGTKVLTARLEISELQEALADAMSVASKTDSRLSMVLSGESGQFLAMGDSGNVETTFPVIENDADAQYNAAFVAFYLQSALKFYRSTSTLTMSLYENVAVFDLPSKDGALVEQRVLMPLREAVARVESAKDKKASKKPEPKAEEQDDDVPPPPKAKPSKPKAPPAPPPEPEEPDAPADAPDEDEENFDDEE
jgi:hypothetical protein